MYKKQIKIDFNVEYEQNDFKRIKKIATANGHLFESRIVNNATK
jgi:hypothetical protein